MHRGIKMTPWEDRQLIEAFDEEFVELVHFAAVRLSIAVSDTWIAMG